MSLRAMVAAGIYGIGEVDSYLLCMGLISRCIKAEAGKAYIYVSMLDVGI
jgi:hypothetical protein